MTRCVGAFRMPCDNLTDRILCERCYRIVERVLDDTRASSRPRRFSPRPKHGKPVAA